MCVSDVLSGDERRAGAALLAADSVTCCLGSGWRREGLSWTFTYCRTSSSAFRRFPKKLCLSAFFRYERATANEESSNVSYAHGFQSVCWIGICCVMVECKGLRDHIHLIVLNFLFRTITTWTSAAVCWLRRVINTCMESTTARMSST